MANISSKETLEKIRIAFLFEHPFLSVLALSLESIYKENKGAIFETNGYQIFIDESKFEKYNFEEIKFQYAHILLHIVLKHNIRKGERDLKIWNHASNIVVNLILLDFENIGTTPKDEPIITKMKDKSVEEVYMLLSKNQNQDFAEQSKEDLLYLEKDTKSLDSILVQALNLAKKAGHLPSSLLIEIDEVIKPEIDMRALLKEYLVLGLFEKEYSYLRPNKRFIHQDIYLPSHKNSKDRVNLIIAIDSSMSVSEELYKKFLGVVEEICEQFYEYKITLIPFEAVVLTDLVKEFESFANIEEGIFNIPKTDGGTNFYSVIEFLENKSVDMESILLVLSDGFFKLEKHLSLESIFLISNKRNLKRFSEYGRVIEFN